jgi:hypothetical protein
MSRTINVPMTTMRAARAPQTHSAPPRPHRHDIDWLRVIAIVLLLYFHTAMIFTAEWGWHIKNPETSHLILEFNYFLRHFRMPVLFLISGIGTGFALGFRAPGRYLRERAKRLLVPLVFGIFVIVPPQIYLERIANGAAYSSYLAFLPSVLEFRPYPAGNLSWHHLWFVLYLFGYSLVALPLFLYLRGDAGTRARAALAPLTRGPGLYLAALPLGLVLALLLPKYPGPQDIIHDWAHLLFYFIFFLYGYLLGNDDALWRAIVDRRRTSLGLALLASTTINVVRWNGHHPGTGYTLESALFQGLVAFNSWCWVVAILGYGKRYLSFHNRFLDYANYGIYPFYILHQTVIVIVGFYVIQVEESVLAKFLFTSTVSLLGTVALYEFCVRPYRLTRFLFGMKPPRRPVPEATTTYPMPGTTPPTPPQPTSVQTLTLPAMQPATPREMPSHTEMHPTMHPILTHPTTPLEAPRPALDTAPRTGYGTP